MASSVIRVRRRRRSSQARRAIVSWMLVAAALIAAYLLRDKLPMPGDTAPSQAPPAAAARIAYDDIHVTDGDTIRVAGERIRILNIDTAEMPGRARCAYEADMALAAKARLGQLLASGEITVARDGVDRYGRTLALLRVDGVDVGEQLIREGAAQRWRGHKAQWC